MELPFHLRTIESLPGALDILRYFGTLEEGVADTEQIIDALDLSDRRFNKAIRRLVTKGYLYMDEDSFYRLTDEGQDSIQELAEYDAASGGLQSGSAFTVSSTQQTTRRMIFAAPNTLVAGKATSIVIGFHPGSMPEPTELAVRLSVVNGEPETPSDILFNLNADATQQQAQITPGPFDRVRIRLQAVQLGPNPGDFNPAGGMYVDLPVSTDGSNAAQTAYATDITLEM